MNEVEGVGFKGPLFGAVVDLELEVGGNPAGLCGGEVCADDFGLRVLVSKVDGPDSFADRQQESKNIRREECSTISCANVEHLLDIGTEWRDVKFASKKKHEKVMPANAC